MIRMMIVYPKSDDSTFDFDYYTGRHMPMVRDRLGAALVKDEVDKAAADQAFHACAHLFFDSKESMGAAMGKANAELMGDIPNYTNTTPQMFMGEVVS